jgi:glycosyltransferase involved in cell wall biosynthesis
MKILFDARSVSGVYTGLGRFTGELAIAVANKVKIKPNIELVIILPICERDNRYVKEILEMTSQNISFQYSATKCVSLKNIFDFGRTVNKLNADVYIYPHFDLPFGIKTSSMIVIHDLFPLIVNKYFPKYHRLKSQLFFLITLLSCKRAQRILSVSKTTRDDIVKLLDKRLLGKIDVIYEGLTLKDTGDRGNAIQNESIKPIRKYLLYVGDRRPHKNIKRILDLYAALREGAFYDGDLIMVGSKDNYDFDVEKYSHKDVKFLGNVDDAVLDIYYRECDALVFLSKYEGFGLPVLEAAYRGRRIISSDGGALAEIVPKWAYVIKNDDSLSVHYSGLSEYLASPIDTSDLTNYMKKYNWDSVAGKVLNHA